MRISKGAPVVLLAVLMVCAAAAAQTERPGVFDPPRCPTVTVSCVDTSVPGESIKFTANVSGADPDVTPTWKWTVPGFRILSGQDTFEITVDTTGIVVSTVVATVEISGGYDRGCSMKADCTTNIFNCPTAHKLDEYGDIRVGDEKQRLDHFTDVLRNDPAAQGYLVCYGGRRSRANEAQRRCDRAMNFLVVSRSMETSRIVTVDGGFREKPTVELWLVPSGAVPPSVSPTVDPMEVRPPRKARSRARR